MNFESFFDNIKKTNIVIDVEPINKINGHFLNNEALFQLPLISLIILILAKDRRKPLVSEIGQLVGESIEDSMIGFKGSAQHLGWSSNLRVRTVKAISFLEHKNMVEIHNLKGKLLITPLGKKVIKKALDQDNDLSYNLSQVARSYRNICVSKQLDLELE